MESVSLGFETLMAYLNRAISQMSDPRQSSNAKRYSFQDLILGAFSVFFMQCESILEHQRYMESHEGHNNAQSLFGISKIPTDPQIRNVLDQTEIEPLFKVFTWMYQNLRQGGWLRGYEFLNGQYLIALDGTNYFSSSKIVVNAIIGHTAMVKRAIFIVRYCL
jgi:hypothetical protein